ncbi:hypothetical protein DL98DRAFT_654145 [Cadophora sp. DSE1049]|nr:hypothetical protein DL98DRAFT_654145 [Cadophora sp. DSE1049]
MVEDVNFSTAIPVNTFQNTDNIQNQLLPRIRNSSSWHPCNWLRTPVHRQFKQNQYFTSSPNFPPNNVSKSGNLPPGPRIVHLTSEDLQPVYCLRVRSDADINTTAFFDLLPEDEHPRWFDQELFTAVRSNCPPGLSSANKESFAVASARYERVFGSDHGFPQTWFDFGRDFLYVNCHGSVGTHELIKSELDRVQNFVIDFGIYHDAGRFLGVPGGQTSWEQGLALFLRDFSGARKIILNNGDECIDNQNIEYEFDDEEALEPLFEDPHRWIYQLAGNLRMQGNTKGADILEAYRHNRQVPLDMEKFEEIREFIKYPGTGPLSTLSVSWQRVATPEQLELYRLAHMLWADQLAERARHRYRIACGHSCSSTRHNRSSCTCCRPYAAAVHHGRACPCGYRAMGIVFEESTFGAGDFWPLRF